MPANTERLEEEDVRGVLAIGGLVGYFGIVVAQLYLISLGVMTVDDVITILAPVTALVTSGISYYFGQKG